MRTEEFKQFQIVVRAQLDTARFGYWHATYQVMECGYRAEKLSGTIAGAFKSSEEAEVAALNMAKRWVDRHVQG